MSDKEILEKLHIQDRDYQHVVDNDGCYITFF